MRKGHQVGAKHDPCYDMGGIANRAIDALHDDTGKDRADTEVVQRHGEQLDASVVDGVHRYAPRHAASNRKGPMASALHITEFRESLALPVPRPLPSRAVDQSRPRRVT